MLLIVILLRAAGWRLRARARARSRKPAHSLIQWQCTSLPKGMPTGWDFEKYLFTPGIYDSVELILTSAPYIVKVES